MSVSDPHGYNYRQTPGADIVALDDTTDWTKATAGTGEDFSDDTVNTKKSTSALSLTTPTDGSGDDAVTITQDSIANIPVDADTWIGLRVYVPALNEELHDSPSPIPTGYVYLYDHATTKTNSWRMKNVAAGNGRLQSGWNMIAGKLSDTGAAGFITIGSPTYSNGIGAVRFELDHGTENNSTSINFVFDKLVVLGTHRPKILFTWDDATDDPLVDIGGDTPKSILDAEDMQATCYIISEVIGNAGIFTLAELNTLYASGWDIANHSSTAENWTSGTVAEGSARYTACRNYLIANGFIRAADHHSLPNGERNLAIDAELESLGCKTARTTKTDIYQHIPNEPVIRPPMFNLGSGNDIATAQAWVDDVIASGGTGVFMGHKIAATAEDSITWAIADFQTLVTYIAAKVAADEVDVVTISEWYNGLSSTRNDATWKARL